MKSPASFPALPHQCLLVVRVVGSCPVLSSVGSGRQQAFPFDFKIAYGRSLAPARVVALGSLNILGKTGHVTVVTACFFERSEGRDAGHHSMRRRRFSARVHDLE